jgi:hypothetical protein
MENRALISGEREDFSVILIQTDPGDHLAPGAVSEEVKVQERDASFHIYLVSNVKKWWSHTYTERPGLVVDYSATHFERVPIPVENLLISLRPPVCPSAWNNSKTAERIFTKFGTGQVSIILRRFRTFQHFCLHGTTVNWNLT